MGHKGVKIFEAFMRPVQGLPLKFHYAWGKVFSGFLKNVMHYRRDEIITNISRSFPEMKYGEVKKVTDEFYDHLGEIFAETMWFGGQARHLDRLHQQNFCEIENMDDLRTSYNESPSIMLVTSHFGNWEIIGGMFEFDQKTPQVESEFGPDSVCVVYKELHSKFWDEFIGNNRCALLHDFHGYTESMKVLRYAVEHRNEKKIYVFPTDQFPYGKAARYELASFMHQKTYAMTGAIALAKKMGMSVFYMSMDRVEKGHYVTTFKKVTDDASKSTIGELTEIYYKMLEEDIQKRPMNYLWSHKRWK